MLNFLSKSIRIDIFLQSNIFESFVLFLLDERAKDKEENNISNDYETCAKIKYSRIDSGTIGLLHLFISVR